MCEKYECEYMKMKCVLEFRECLIEVGATLEMTWRKIYEVVKDDSRCERCEFLVCLDVFESIVCDLVCVERVKFEVECKVKVCEECKCCEDFVALFVES